MKKLHVLEVNKAYYPHIGGIESIVKQYSEELTELGADVKTLVCRNEFGCTLIDNINGIKVVRAGIFGKFFSCPLSLSFIILFKKMAKNADVVHINIPFPLSDLALMLSGYKGKVAVSWHSDIVRQKKLMRFYKPFLMYLLRRTDVIFVATEGHINNSDYILPYLEKCKILPYGLKIDEYLSIKRIPYLTDRLTDKDNLKVLFTGRLVYYKGVHILLKSFSLVEGCELFIVGTGKLENKLKAYVYSNGLNSKVHFLSFLPTEELRQAYADCDIFVLPSVVKSEAFGIVQLEAMVYGKPIINTQLSSGVPYLSIHGKTGLTVPPKKPKALAAAINKLVAEPELRKKMGRNAAEHVKKQFNESDIIPKLYKYLADGIKK